MGTITDLTAQKMAVNFLSSDSNISFARLVKTSLMFSGIRVARLGCKKKRPHKGACHMRMAILILAMLRSDHSLSDMAVRQAWANFY